MRNTFRFPVRARTPGFTLVEVLVAVLVLAIGLLGMAGLQALGLQNNNTAYLRSQATFLAYELADRMRANNKAVADGYYGSVAGDESDPGKDCTSTPCNQSEMAQNDIYQWLQAVQESLPMGKGTVTRSGAIHTITISWDDNRDGVVTAANECDPNDPTKDPCFKLSVQP